jgi:hypothetical protein
MLMIHFDIVEALVSHHLDADNLMFYTADTAVIESN